MKRKPEAVRAVANRIARELFTFGVPVHGRIRRATRLVLVDLGDYEMGGWSEGAMADHIAKLLRAAKGRK